MSIPTPEKLRYIARSLDVLTGFGSFARFSKLTL